MSKERSSSQCAEEVFGRGSILQGSIPDRIEMAGQPVAPDHETGKDIQNARLNEERIERARSLGLDEGATWAEIYTALNEQERQNVAAELSLNPSASWRRITAEILGLPGTASDVQMIEQIRKRLGVD